MNPASCERCGSPNPVAAVGAAVFCEDCILKALAARFPLGDAPLEDLAAAIRPGPGERNRVHRARGA
jgi:hypothetical protein